MTKTTLLAATAIAAMAFAGAAAAGTITGTVNGVTVAAATTAAPDAPWTIAAERVDAPDATALGNFTLIQALSASEAAVVTAATAVATNNVYEATFNVTNGTFGNLAGLGLTGRGTVDGAGGVVNLAAANFNTVTVVSATASQVVVRFTLTTGAAIGNSVALSSITLTGATINNAAENNIIFSGAINDLGATGATLVATRSSTGNTTLIRYQNAVLAFTATQRSVLAGLSDFKLFKAAVTGTPATVAANRLSVTNLATYAVTDTSATTFRTGLANNTIVNRDGIINGATVVVTGAALSDTTIVPSIAGAAPTSRSGNSASFTLGDAAADALSLGANLGLTTTGANAIPATQFTTSWTPIYAAGFTAPTTAQIVNSGSIALDGINFIAPWFSGSQAQTQSQLRLSNTSATAANVTLRITSLRFGAGGANFFAGTHSCATGAFSVAAGNELVIGSDQVRACFGDFARGDLLVTVEAADGSITAKVRNSSASGNFETSLGRYTGSSVAPN